MKRSLCATNFIPNIDENSLKGRLIRPNCVSNRKTNNWIFKSHSIWEIKKLLTFIKSYLSSVHEYSDNNWSLFEKLELVSSYLWTPLTNSLRINENARTTRTILFLLKKRFANRRESSIPPPTDVASVIEP